ncbi:MAG: SDR family oxidoreductase [Planctomycetes bacterium]|nr:SDR family oxidoreductase [Planctomycetota bacterium]
MRLTEKTILITGSSSGIGKAIARLFAREGATVILCSNKTSDQGEALAEELRASGAKAGYYQADLRREEDIGSLFAAIKRDYGILDVLVNNAGRSFQVPFEDYSAETLLNDLSTNLVSAMLCAKYATPLMTNPNGWIINTSSIRGNDLSGRPGIMGYCASKAGINSFTRNLALQLAPKIFVNAVQPGFVRTDFLELIKEEMQKNWLAHTPIGRFVEPDEIAEVYLMLATTRIFTGAVITPDGGYSMLAR